MSASKTPAGEKLQAPFPSNLWATTFMNLLNTSKSYESAAKNWEGAMLFIIQADGGQALFDIGCWLDLWHGKCRGYKFWIPGQDKPKSDYEFTGPEKNWMAMVDGKLDPIQGLMTGKFRLMGNMAMVMRQTTAAKVLLEMALKIELDLVLPDVQDPKVKLLTFFDKNKKKVMIIDTQQHTFTFVQ